LRAALVVNATFAMMTGYEIQNSALVASTQTLILAGANGLALLVALGATLASACRERGACAQSLERLLAPPLPPPPPPLPSPSPSADDAPPPSLEFDARAVVAALHAAWGAIDAAEAALSPALVPIHELEAQMGVLQRHWVAAKACDSLLEVISLRDGASSHGVAPFATRVTATCDARREASLRECLDDLALLVARRRPASLLPGGALAATLDASARTLVSRRQQKLLMSEKKRAILLKLLSLRMFLSLASARRGPSAAQQWEGGEYRRGGIAATGDIYEQHVL